MLNEKLKIAILGSGPSSAFASRACYDMGFRNITVLSQTANQHGHFPAGSFYLHWIPETVQKERTVVSQMLYTFATGSQKAYIARQYNGTVKGNVRSSFPKHPTLHRTWDYSTVQPFLWLGATFRSQTFGSDEEIEELLELYDLVLHGFPSYESRYHYDPPPSFPVATYNLRSPLMRGTWERFLDLVGISINTVNNWVAKVYRQGLPPAWPDSPNWIYYNGTQDLPFVRFSYLWGMAHVEFPVNYHTQYPEKVKAIEDTTNGWTSIQRNLLPTTQLWTKQIASNIYPIGRFATWDSTQLSHDTYSRVSGILNSYTTEG